MPVTVVLRSLRQGDSKSEASLGHTVSSRPTYCALIFPISMPPPSKKKRKNKERDGEEEDGMKGGHS